MGGGRFRTASMTIAGVPLLLLALLAQGCDRTPAAPERHGIPQVLVSCEPASATSAACRASVVCSLYPCQRGTPDDVTAVATWSVDSLEVARVTGPGRLEAGTPGHTLVRAAWSGSSHWVPIAVFSGTPPLQTYTIEGRVYEGTPASRVPIDGAVIEILDGVVAGQKGVSGSPATGLPAPGLYRIPGVPIGSFRIRVTRAGYIAQEREVAGAGFTGVDFYLQRE